MYKINFNRCRPSENTYHYLDFSLLRMYFINYPVKIFEWTFLDFNGITDLKRYFRDLLARSLLRLP